MALASINNLRSQWFPPKPLFTETEVPLQQGKVFIVTGGNRGVGHALIKILYGTGATIYMASRSKDSAERAIQEIVEETPAPKTPGKIRHLQLDLNDLVSVKEAALSFAKQESKLDVLWNNAGPGAHTVEFGVRTAQDLEPLVGANCVATLLFSTLLVPRLRAASTTQSCARVVWTSSYLAEGASPTNGVDLSLLDKGTADRTKNYAISKAASWMLSREFARRFGKDGIISVTLNPGNLQTGGYDGVSSLTMVFIKPLLHDPRFGAYTELYAGLSTDISLENNGAYVIPWGRLRPDEACPRKDILNAMKTEEEGGSGIAKKLWEWCELKGRSFA